jgi:hypothetical protein
MPDGGFFPTETIHYTIVIVLNKDFLLKREIQIQEEFVLSFIEFE